MSPKLEISFVNEKKFPISKKMVEKIILNTVAFFKKKNIQVEIVIISDSEMRKLNKIWRGIDKTTDVLSYAWNEDKKIKSVSIGQVFISYPQVARQAAEYYIPVRTEFSRMLVHGLLHLMGFDHQEEKEAEKMFDYQEKIIAKIV